MRPRLARVLLFVCALAVLSSAATAVAGTSVQIRRIDVSRLPLVRVTAVVPRGERPSVLEDGAPAAYASVRELGLRSDLVLAVDNSQSMVGRPLSQVKRAATTFLRTQQHSGSTGLVIFGHQALALTRANESSEDVAATLAAVAPDVRSGTALYDAIALAVGRLKSMPTAEKVLVLLTDGRDVGSRESLGRAISAAQHADVVVYPIAAGRRADVAPLRQIASATGGQLFSAADVAHVARAYAALHRQLNQTWQISYLTSARQGEAARVTIRAGAASASAVFATPRGKPVGGLIAVGVAQREVSVVGISLVVGILVALAAGVGIRRRDRVDIAGLLTAHTASPDSRALDAPGDGLRGTLASLERAFERLPGSAKLDREIDKAGLRLRPGAVYVLVTAFCFVFGILAALVTPSPAVILLAMLVGLFAPIGGLRVAATRRTKAFDRQLPEVLASVASSLRAGHGLRTALRAVADDGTPPASEEFVRVLGEERLGRPLHEAIAAMCERLRSPDLDYVATAINVQSQTGGSLAALFDTLSETVRERQRHARKVRALTSMGRMSAAILLCLPFGLTFLMTLLDPPYMAPLFKSSAGHALIAVCLFSMGLGAVVLRRIVNVRY